MLRLLGVRRVGDKCRRSGVHRASFGNNRNNNSYNNNKATKNISVDGSSLPLYRPFSSRFQHGVDVLSRGGGWTARRFTSGDFSSPLEDGAVSKKLLELIDGGSVQADPHQLKAARELDRLYFDLMATATTDGTESHGPSGSQREESASAASPGGSFLSGLFRSLSGGNNDSDSRSAAYDGPIMPRGIYTYGGVGCGKTFLMELFYEALDEDPNWSSGRNKKQIVHYHKFMLNVHQFMHTSKKEQKEAGIVDGHPIDAVVDHVLKSGRLICLDEFQVTDVADAMILKELFGRLWKRGCTLVTTSNRPPRDLYLHGLQRDRFLPFVDMLEDRCAVVSLMENETDYRMVISARDHESNHYDDENGNNNVNGNNNDNSDSDKHNRNEDDADSKHASSTSSVSNRARQVYFCGRDQAKILQKLFYERARGRPTNPSTLETQGRKVKIPMACKAKSICMFSFEDLCQKALGAADYLVIGQNFSTVFVYGVPPMTVHEINWLRRFITFVDSMYEWKVRVLLQTNANSLSELFSLEGDKTSYQQDEVFAFDRTFSRLGEMSSTQYLSSQWLGSETGTSVGTKLDLEPSLADQWFQLVGTGATANIGNRRRRREGNVATADAAVTAADNEALWREIFDKLDSNKDGVLDKDEVKALMTDAFGYEPIDLVVNEMIASVDTDRDGVIDQEEFRALLEEIEDHKNGRNQTNG